MAIVNALIPLLVSMYATASLPFPIRCKCNKVYTYTSRWQNYGVINRVIRTKFKRNTQPFDWMGQSLQCNPELPMIQLFCQKGIFPPPPPPPPPPPLPPPTHTHIHWLIHLHIKGTCCPLYISSKFQWIFIVIEPNSNLVLCLIPSSDNGVEMG